MVLCPDPKKVPDMEKSTNLHMASRESPYPGTSVERFPVFDKYINWEVRLCVIMCRHVSSHASLLSPLDFITMDLKVKRFLQGGGGGLKIFLISLSKCKFDILWLLMGVGGT